MALSEFFQYTLSKRSSNVKPQAAHAEFVRTVREHFPPHHLSGLSHSKHFFLRIEFETTLVRREPVFSCYRHGSIKVMPPASNERQPFTLTS